MEGSQSQRKRSALWNHFSQTGPKKAKCSYCGNELSISCGNVGNLGRHLSRKHPTVKLIEERQTSTPPPPPELAPMEPIQGGLSTVQTVNAAVQILPVASHSSNPVRVQPSILEYAQSTKPMPLKRSQQVDAQLLKMIARGHYPFRLVEDPEFKKLLALLNPQYQLPTRKTLSESLLQKQYNTCLEKVKTEVQKAQAVCLTTDGWTSVNNDSFLAVTVHYIEPSETKLKSNLIGCVEYNERHTSNNLTAFLRDIMANWNISDYTTAIASDNAANITAAIRDGSWRHIPCFAHSLNLCVQSALTHLGDSVGKVKTIVEFFKRSSQAQQKLVEMQKQLNLAELKLKQDVPTRWNSTYDMLQRVIRAKDAVIATIALTRPELALNQNDWEVIESATPILKLFYEITVEISAEKNISLAKIIPLCRIMKRNVKSQQTNSLLPEVRALMDTLDKELEKRFSHIEKHVLYTEATILDPRFKIKGFMSEELYAKAVSDLKFKVGSVNLTAPPTVPPTPASFTKGTIWDEFDEEVAKLTPENPLAAGIVELDKYLQEPLLPRTHDPLKWWHERRMFYPNLYKYALKRLHLVATSVPCERIFSKAGNILNDRRTRLTTKKLSQLLFISSNCD